MCVGSVVEAAGPELALDAALNEELQGGPVVLAYEARIEGPVSSGKWKREGKGGEERREKGVGGVVDDGDDGGGGLVDELLARPPPDAQVDAELRQCPLRIAPRYPLQASAPCTRQPPLFSPGLEG